MPLFCSFLVRVFCIHHPFYPVGFFLLRFIIGAHLQFGNNSNGNKLNTSHYQEDTKQEKRFSPNVVSCNFQNEHVEVNECADSKRTNSKASEKVHGPLHVFFEKEHQEEVAHYFGCSAQIIFRGSVFPGPVVHINLCYTGGSFQGNQYRNKAVQLAVNVNTFDGFAGENFKRTSQIFHFGAG